MYKNRYSKYIRPILYGIDLLIIYLLSFFLLTQSYTDLMFFILFWVLLSVLLSFYKVYRFTKIIEIIALLFKQTVTLVLLITSYLYVSKSDIPWASIVSYFIWLFVVLNIWRIFLYEIFKKYRIITGSNYRNVVVIGDNESTKKLINFFNSMPGYGYRYKGFFTNQPSKDKIGNIEQSFDFISNGDIDEIYCSLDELDDDAVKSYIDFCDVQMKNLKFIPDTKEIFAKNLHLIYYDLVPIISLREIPLDDPIKSGGKRLFDFILAALVMVTILSWLIPILALIIKLESKGPVFFKQNRPGIKEKGFFCYKFRSMHVNSVSENSATRNDPRTTRVGKFIRRTSIDELPQFINVLFGDMSVVGPRPHLWKQNELYGTTVSKYMVRHLVKPGITGLAQVKGYRGGIETNEDIVNRTKYDIFYIENWSVLLDIYIIVQTVINIFKGEEKAY
ncbi:undecaprenyl-phosphate glucose phosphotransferase [Aquimarina litoralis]|uniref:undecaprenyl-phosphate glucose phosphotransferase n=1 Tax=Aquimarina litoralis TaxID=584605 RepID=UPI001C58562F|nr:undecaprenyl-phosphate glucose phosphotransferase [Aquimarina litoralis]MBW1293915.1 undecaprenyl-phosphate glucose phosphotransferase [Aquimarina litoralis]